MSFINMTPHRPGRRQQSRHDVATPNRSDHLHEVAAEVRYTEAVLANFAHREAVGSAAGKMEVFGEVAVVTH